MFRMLFCFPFLFKAAFASRAHLAICESPRATTCGEQEACPCPVETASVSASVPAPVTPEKESPSPPPSPRPNLNCPTKKEEFKKFCKENSYCVRCTYENPSNPVKLVKNGLDCPICDA